MTLKQIDIAAHLDLTPPAVSDFIRANKLDWQSMTLDEIRIFYIQKLRARAMGRTGEGDDYDGIQEKARLLHNQANKAELEVEVMRGNLIPIEKVTAEWTDIVSAFRAKLVSLPTRIAAGCFGREQSEIESESKKIVNEALDELARECRY